MNFGRFVHMERVSRGLTAAAGVNIECLEAHDAAERDASAVTVIRWWVDLRRAIAVARGGVAAQELAGACNEGGEADERRYGQGKGLHFKCTLLGRTAERMNDDLPISLLSRKSL